MLNGITADDRKQCAGVRCVKAQVDRQSIGEHNDGKIENALEMSHEDNIFARQDPAHIQIRADHSDKQDSRTNQPDCKVLSSGKPNQKASFTDEQLHQEHGSHPNDILIFKHVTYPSHIPSGLW